MHPKHSFRLWLFSIAVASIALAGCGSDKKLTDQVSTVVVSSASRPIGATLTYGQPRGGSELAITVTTNDPLCSIPLSFKQIQVRSPSRYIALAIGVEGIDGYFELFGLTPTGDDNFVNLHLQIGNKPREVVNLQVFGGTTHGYGSPESVLVEICTPR
jgi:hypothetical protein